MTRAARIRQWLADNPGWHFAGDICDGLALAGKDRLRCMQELARMGELGLLVTAGARGSMRYTPGRSARKYTTRAG